MMNIEEFKLMVMIMKKSPNVFCPHLRQRPTCASGTGAFHWWSPRQKTSPGQKTEVSLGGFWGLGVLMILVYWRGAASLSCVTTLSRYLYVRYLIFSNCWKTGWANYHLRVFVCEVFNLQVSAEVGVLLVHMLENHLGTTVILIIVYKEIINVIFGPYLLLRLLSAS